MNNNSFPSKLSNYPSKYSTNKTCHIIHYCNLGVRCKSADKCGKLTIKRFKVISNDTNIRLFPIEILYGSPKLISFDYKNLNLLISDVFN